MNKIIVAWDRAGNVTATFEPIKGINGSKTKKKTITADTLDGVLQAMKDYEDNIYAPKGQP